MNAILPWLVETGWQSAVMTAVLGTLLFLTGRSIPAAWRYGILFLIVIRMLLPALPQAPVSAYRIVPATPEAAWEQALPGNPLPPWNRPDVEVPGPSHSTSTSPAWDWQRAAGILWVSGILFLSAWVFLRQIFFLRNLQRSRQSPSGSVTALLAEAASLAGLRHPPRICTMEGLPSPALIGWLRPTILLPAGFENHHTPDSLRFVLLHECIHLRRGDLWTHTLSMAAALLHWWNPAVWWLMARLHAERELATDAGVLRLLTREDQRAYGETLMNLAEHGTAGVYPAPSLGVLEKHTVLRRRIRQIAGFGRVPLIGATLGILLLVALSITLLFREPTPPLDPIPTDTQEREQVIRGFLDKVQNGDLKGAEEYLRRGLDANATNHYDSALYWAVTKLDAPMVEMLLRHGARVDDKNSWGDTPINRACWMGNEKIINILISAGATSDPLLLAAGMGDVAALEKRQTEQPLSEQELKKVAEFSCAANRQATFDWAWAHLSTTHDEAARVKLLNGYLSTTASWGRLPMMKHVVSLGADVKKAGKSALRRAVNWNRLPEAAYLMDLGVSPASEPDDFRGMLGSAAGEGHLEIVRLLLDHGAGINDQDKSGMTPLSWAAYCRHDAVCRLLIERGANISLKDERGETALWRAAFGGNLPEVVELLLSKGADPGGVNTQGSPILTAMQLFVPPQSGKVSYPGKIYTPKEREELEARTKRVVELLIKGGADQNAKGASSPSPLVDALTGGHPDIALALMKNGADALRPDAKGNTPIAYAFIGRWGEPTSLEVIRELLDRGADPNATLTGSAYYEVKPEPPPVSILELALAKAGALHNDPDARKETQKAITLLLSRGAKFQSAGGPKADEWLAAATSGDISRLRQLHKEGVDINTSTPQGWNALSIALALGHSKEATWLMDSGIDLASQGATASPLFLAVQAGDDVMVKKILAAGGKPSTEIMVAASMTGKLPIFEALHVAGGDASQVELNTLIRKGYTDILRIAVENGTDVWTNTNYENRNNVYWAVYYNRPEILNLLLEYGTPPNLKDNYGMTPLEYAKKFRKDLVPALEAAIKKTEEKTVPTS